MKPSEEPPEAILLSWKQEQDPQQPAHFEALAAAIGEEKAPGELWRCGLNNAPVGTPFYLHRQGKNNAGIFGSGVIMHEPSEALGEPLGSDRRPVKRVLIRFNELINPLVRPTLPRPELVELLPAINWKAQRSGTYLRVQTDELEIAWQRHLQAQKNDQVPMVRSDIGVWLNAAQLNRLRVDEQKRIWAAVPDETHFVFVAETGQLMPASWAAPLYNNRARFFALQRLLGTRSSFRGYSSLACANALERALGAPSLVDDRMLTPLPAMARQALSQGAKVGAKWLWQLRRPERIGEFFAIATTETITRKSTEISMPKDPLNQIFYGPPGCGKTWEARREAVRLCDGFLPNGEAAVSERLRQLIEAHRVDIVTFHQNYTYEDFVEGIRPALQPAANTFSGVEGGLHAGKPESDAKARGLAFERRKGIFRKFCERADPAFISDDDAMVVEDALGSVDIGLGDKRVWKISLGEAGTKEGEKVYDACMRDNCIALSYGLTRADPSTSESAQGFAVAQSAANHDVKKYGTSTIYRFSQEPSIGDFVVVTRGNRFFRAIGRIISNYRFAPNENYPHMRDVEWLFREDFGRQWSQLTERPFTQPAFYDLTPNIVPQRLLAFLQKSESNGPPEKAKPFVFIIDEINRGNTAAIFGELLTLIEEDKRTGADNATPLILPVSQEIFSVPKNVYIIGTMNSTDRSVGAIDLALRRRFRFRKLDPNPKCILDGSKEDKKSIVPQIRALMEAINWRLAAKLGGDYQIGHSFFMGVEDLCQLRDVFQFDIVPLLEEYFEGNRSRVKEILKPFGSGKNKTVSIFIRKKIDDRVAKLVDSSDNLSRLYEFRESFVARNANKEQLLPFFQPPSGPVA